MFRTLLILDNYRYQTWKRNIVKFYRLIPKHLIIQLVKFQIDILKPNTTFLTLKKKSDYFGKRVYHVVMRESICPRNRLYKYSLLMHRIKIESPAKLLWNEQNVFVGGFTSFQSALTLAVLQWQKSLPDIGGTTIQDVAPLAPMQPGVHIMSIYFKFRAIYFWLLNEY